MAPLFWAGNEAVNDCTAVRSVIAQFNGRSLMRIASARIPCANRVGLVGLRRTVRTTGTRISTCLTGGLRMPAMLGSTFMEVVTYSITHCRITLNGTHIDRHSRGHCSRLTGSYGLVLPPTSLATLAGLLTISPLWGPSTPYTTVDLDSFTDSNYFGHSPN